MEARSLPIYNTEGKEVGSLELDAVLFDGKINTASLHQAIVAYRANQRKGLAATKTRGEVSGGGKKPWRQKGTGRARVGSTRSPLWRHGGVIFGPHPRDYSYTLPQKIKTLALKSALCAKLNANNFILLDNFSLQNPKTKEAVSVFSNLKANPKLEKKYYSVLLLLDETTEELRRALANIGFLKFTLAKDVNAYEILASKKIVAIKDGFDLLVERLKKCKSAVGKAAALTDKKK
jgi:large subunit ribosomal protein L4